MSVVYAAGVPFAAERNDRDVWADHRARLELDLLPQDKGARVAHVNRSPRQVQLRRQPVSVDTTSVFDIVAGVVAPDPTSFLPLPPAQLHVLVALSEGEKHGYAIMQGVEESSAGVVRMGPATLYGTLKRLVEHGLIEELAQRPSSNDDQRRRYYRLTGLGERVCVAEADRLAALVRRTRSSLQPRRA